MQGPGPGFRDKRHKRRIASHPMVARVSTLSQFLFAQETIGTQIQTRQGLNQRLATGRQHPTLSAYRQDLPRLVGLQTENALLSRQQASLDVTRTFLDAYTETLIGTRPLGTREGAATGLTGLAELVLAELTDLYNAVNDATDPNESFNDVQTRKQASVDDILRSVTSLLNKRVGDRYLFSGYRYRTAPVQDLSEALVTPAAGGVVNLALLPVADLDENFETALKDIDPAAIATGELAEYDSEFDPADPLATNEDAVGAHRINLASDSVFSYGIHANEAFVQEFIQTLRLYRSLVEADVFDPRGGGAFDPAVQADLEDEDTLEGFVAVLDGLRDRLRDSIEAFQTRTEAHLTLEIRLTQRRSELRSTLQANQSQIAAIQSADPNTVAVELSVLNLQLQASFQAITTARNLSLVNFL